MAPDRGVLAAQLRSTYVRLKGGERPSSAPTTAGPVGPPDFVGIGAQKAGTSWWYELITAHPNVRDNAGDQKELQFFTRYWDGPHARLLAGKRGSVQTHHFQGAWGSGVDIDAYHRFFPVRPGSITGEWTPRYMADWWGPGCLAAAAPDARLLVMVRDPVDRYRSALTRVAFEGRVRPNDSAEAFERGRYASQLARLRDWFPKSQVLVLQYERCVAQPAGELHKTYEFLGLDDPDFTPDGLSDPVNETVAPKINLVASWLDRLRSAYESEVRALVAEYPDIDLTLWPNFASL